MPLVHDHGTTTRTSDSGARYALQVTEDPDGDVYVAILYDGLPLEATVDGERVRSRVEFVVSHPRSPEVILILRQLRSAMGRDNKVHPIE